MSIGIIPQWIQTGDGSDSVLIALGSHAGGQDLALKLGGESRTLTVKRDGTLLDSGDKLDGLVQTGSQLKGWSHGLTSPMHWMNQIRALPI